MEPTTYSFQLLTDTFSHGAYQTQDFNQPELRAPSVKGMIRWWHRALGLSEQNSDRIFGGLKPKPRASAVAFRIKALGDPVIENREFMPHKGHKGGRKNALLPGSRFELILAPRRGGLEPDLTEELRRATECWLLLGAIGQRSNRGAGAIMWDAAPSTQRDFEIRASELLQNAAIRFCVLDRDLGEDWTLARDIAGDFLADKAFHGTAPFGSARPRKPSPLKLTCAWLDGSLRLVAIWDCRKESPRNLEEGVR